jgi:hypothetical protein
MDSRTARRAAWSACALSLILALAWAAYVVANLDAIRAGTGLGLSHQGALIALSFSMVGGLIASSRHDNAIGWIFLVIGLSGGGWALNEILMTTPQVDSDWNRWVQTWVWVPAWFSMITFVPLLFPDGRLPSRRWRAVPWLSGFAVVVSMAGSMLHVNAGSAPDYRNPLIYMPEASLALELVLVTGLAVGLIAAAASLVALTLRYRRSGRTQRQQIKWFAYAAVATVVLGVGRTVLATNVVLQAMGVVSIPLIPIATGVAIFRYRLYDIDRIINRTLVYGALTSVLGATYLSAVVLFQGALGSLTEGNALAVAGATLAVAAVFRPARNAIQDFIDRRFYRAKYDSALTLETFALGLREDKDLDTLARELTDVVRQTMQPTHTSLWLAPSTGRAPLGIRD